MISDYSEESAKSSPHRAFLEKVVLGEIEGKHKAIHGYDGIIWKIRAGYMTLLFGGWAIFLKGIVDASTQPANGYVALAVALLTFSLGFSLGAWYIDRNYVRRKFRVILALGRLIDQIRQCEGDYLQVPVELLKVAGDNGDMPYECSGYDQAVMAGMVVYLAAVVTIIAGVVLVVA